MSLKILVPLGYITVRQYAEKYMIPVEVVRLWVRSNVIESIHRGVTTASRKVFVMDIAPPVKHKRPFDSACPLEYMPLNMWCLREKISYDAASKKIASGELPCKKIGGRYYAAEQHRWKWDRPRSPRTQIVYT